MKGLLVKQPWIDKILSGEKTWELRGSPTRNLGRIALIESGTGLVVGTCVLTGVEGPLSLEQLEQSVGRHCVTKGELRHGLPYERTFAWVLSDAQRLRSPVPYKHLRGAIIWVNLAPEVAATVRSRYGKTSNPGTT